MKVVVTVKQVPEPTGPRRIDPATKRLVREGVEVILCPADESGVEEGLRLVEAHGGELIVVSMGPEHAREALRKALAMGATRGVLVTDPALAGSDTWATARVLAEVIRREQPDVIISASESTDASTGLVSGQLGELLGIPQLTFAKKINIGDGKATVHRQTSTGFAVVEGPLPALITVASGINEPRYPSLKGIMAARRKEIRELDAAALGLAPAAVGESGALEQVLDVKTVEEQKSGTVVKDDGQSAERIVAFLETVNVL
ncbi:MAG: electron transfer flavoprotein subunit beta/FixA family protein [Chloroflexi bacterium]|nr:electron transfer flavoprotein subunit beta/FixA family protein [Chloroflexota bacterium]